MLSSLRMKALDRLFGGGPTGLVAAGMLGWFIDQARDSLRKEPQRLDVARLVPGETYLVTTRPAMSRKEAKVAARHDAVARKLVDLQRPPRQVDKVARCLAAAQHRAAAAPEGSARQARQTSRARQLEARYIELTTPSAKQLELQATVDRLAAELDDYRAKALKSSAKSARPRTKVFR